MTLGIIIWKKRAEAAAAVAGGGYGASGQGERAAVRAMSGML